MRWAHLLAAVVAAGCAGSSNDSRDGNLLDGDGSIGDAAPPRDCTGPDGVLIPQGTSRLYYRTPVEPCQSEARTCTDGTLSGSYAEPYCGPETAPYGSLDSTDTVALYGWACDPDDPATPLFVDIYLDGPYPSGTYVGSAYANVPRADLPPVCSGRSDHGFVYTLPKALADGGRHTLYGYAHEHNGSRVPLLSGTPALNYPITVAAYYFPNWHAGGEWPTLHAAVPKWTWPGPGWQAIHVQPKLPDPAWDNDDESDPAQFAQKVDAAAANGVSVLLFDWYYNDAGPYLEEALTGGYLNAANRDDIRFAIMWANHNLVTGPGVITSATWSAIVTRLVGYFTRSSYWKPDMKPYFSIYQPATFVASWGDPANLASWDLAKTKLDELRSAAVTAGLAGVHINLVDFDLKDDPQAAAKATRLGADSLTSYTWGHFDAVAYLRTNCTTPDNPPYEDYSGHFSQYDAHLTESADYASWTFPRYGKPYFPVVSMGWDPTPRIGATPLTCPGGVYGNAPVIVNNTPDRFAGYLQTMRTRLDAAPASARLRFVTIYAWNEWTEGGFLEPEIDDPAGGHYGWEYLHAIRDTF